MKNKKLVAVVSIMAVLVIGIASVAYAVDFKRPAEIVAGLTGKRVEEVIANRQKGESYGEQAKDAGKLAEFQAAAQEQMKARLNALVAEGKMTQAQADARIKAMADRAATCDGEGTAMGNGGPGGLGGGLRDGSGAGQGMGGGRGGMARGGMTRGNGGVCIVDNAA